MRADKYLIATFPSMSLRHRKLYPAVKRLILFIWQRKTGADRQDLFYQRRKNQGSRRLHKWFETQDSNQLLEDFTSQKLSIPNMTKYMPFVYDDNAYCTNQKCVIITGQAIAYLTAFFNSSLFKFCFRDSFPELQGGTREMSKIFFGQNSGNAGDRRNECTIQVCC